MRRFALWVALGTIAFGVDACGGKASKSGSTVGDASTSGGSAGQSSPSGASSGTANASGTGGLPGTCLALCIPTAQLMLKGFPPDDLFTHSFRACRNGECYEGAFPPQGGNAVRLAGGTPDETTVELVYFEDPPLLELRLVWALKAYSKELMDGDHYTVSATSSTGEVSTLIDELVSYEHYDHCSGPCTRADVEVLTKSPTGDAGATSRDQ